MRKKKTQEEFISEAVAIHGDKYSYEKTVYAGTDTKVAIWCNVHKVLFWQTPYLHLKGSGCKQCVLDKLSKKFSHTKEQFLEKCRKAHGDRFDYSNVEYINSNTKVEIVCRKHGSFWMTPAAHTGAFKSVCPVCAMQSTISSLQSRSIPFEEFVERARITHGPDKYDYSLANYKGAVHKIQILCKKHNKVFCQQPHKHMTGQGCPLCKFENSAASRRLDVSVFINRAKSAHGDGTYDYSLVEYKNCDEPVKIICKEHGVFLQTPYSHYAAGSGCPQCATTGFNRTIPGKVYILESETMLKVGITNKEVSERLSSVNRNSPETFVEVFHKDGCGNVVDGTETALLDWLRGISENPSVKFDGYTEAFIKKDFGVDDVISKLIYFESQLTNQGNKLC